MSLCPSIFSSSTSPSQLLPDAHLATSAVSSAQRDAVLRFRLRGGPTTRRPTQATTSFNEGGITSARSPPYCHGSLLVVSTSEFHCRQPWFDQNEGRPQSCHGLPLHEVPTSRSLNHRRPDRIASLLKDAPRPMCFSCSCPSATNSFLHPFHLCRLSLPILSFAESPFSFARCCHPNLRWCTRVVLPVFA